MKNWITATGLMSALMGSAACAQSAPPAPTLAATTNSATRTRAEFLADSARRFDAMDTNKDGLLSREERRAADLRPAGRHRRPPSGGRFGPEGAPGATIPPQTPNDTGRETFGEGGRGTMLARLDTNGDGTLSRAEFAAPFDRLDANGDGAIDKGEMDRLRGRFGGRRFGGQEPSPDEAQLEPQ